MLVTPVSVKHPIKPDLSNTENLDWIFFLNRRDTFFVPDILLETSFFFARKGRLFRIVILSAPKILSMHEGAQAAQKHLHCNQG